MNLLTAPDTIRLVSLLLLLALTLHTGLGIWSWLRRQALERRNAALQLEHWNARVAAGKAMRPTVAVGWGGWEGWRKFEVSRIDEESPSTRSFFLRAHDRQPLPGFLPGQHLTFQLRIPGRPRPVVRCYSLSSGPDAQYYRFSVKRVRFNDADGNPQDGVSSGFLHDQIQRGAILDIKAPTGDFHLDPSAERPMVLLAGGIGVTPFVSMLEDIAARGDRREVWLFYSVRNSQDEPFGKRLRELDHELDNLQLRILHSRPLREEDPGQHYHHPGRLDRVYLASQLPSSNYDFFLCGPPAMMAALNQQLRDWGVPSDNLHSEAFGPAAIPPPKAETAIEVVFERSGKTLRWTGGSLLDLAEANRIQIDSGCRGGSCGSCLTAIKSGSVEYTQPHGMTPEQGSCLACVCVPRERLVVDA